MNKIEQLKVWTEMCFITKINILKQFQKVILLIKGVQFLEL